MSVINAINHVDKLWMINGRAIGSIAWIHILIYVYKLVQYSRYPQFSLSLRLIVEWNVRNAVVTWWLDWDQIALWFCGFCEILEKPMFMSVAWEYFWESKILRINNTIVKIVEIEWIFQASKYLWNIYVSHMDIFENPIWVLVFENFFEFWIRLLIEIEWIFQASKYLWNLGKINIYATFISISVIWYFRDTFNSIQVLFEILWIFNTIIN